MVLAAATRDAVSSHDSSFCCGTGNSLVRALIVANLLSHYLHFPPRLSEWLHLQYLAGLGAISDFVAFCAEIC